MKLIIVSIFIAAISAETLNKYQSASQEQAPYQPSGWRPSGPEFRLPARQQQLPQVTYGVPAQEYGPPTTTEIEDFTTTELPFTSEKSEKQIKKTDKLVEDSSLVSEGVYYIYHPSGLLQRVVYSTKDDSRNMAYTAQLKYHDVEPIRDPIYTYDPNTFVFQKLQV